MQLFEIWWQVVKTKTIFPWCNINPFGVALLMKEKSEGKNISCQHFDFWRRIWDWILAVCFQYLLQFKLKCVGFSQNVLISVVYNWTEQFWCYRKCHGYLYFKRVFLKLKKKTIQQHIFLNYYSKQCYIKMSIVSRAS